MRLLVLLLVSGCGVSSSLPDATYGDGQLVEGGAEEGGSADGTAEPDELTGPPKLENTIVSGYAFDGRSGKPLAAVSVTTEPPLESVSTNQQGSYVVNAGQAFGRLTVRAARDGYVQRAVSCVTLKSGRSVIADLSLVSLTSAGDTECEPACDDTSTCVDGVCVSKCNPPCGCSDRCTASGACEPDPDAPPVGVCGSNAIALGGGVCECQKGYVPAGDGRSCSKPASDASCPPGSVLTASGSCACKGGYVPNPAGDACVLADELAVVTPLSGVTESGRGPTPGPAPRGVAFDGGRLWIGDAVRRSIDDAGGSGSVSLGAAGVRLVDIAAGPVGIYAIFSEAEGNGEPTLALIDTDSGAVTPIAANDFEPSPGVAWDGLQLASVEGNRLVRRSGDLGQITSFSTIELTDPPPLSVTPPPLAGTFSTPGVAFLAVTGNRAISWEGTLFDGTRFLTQFAVLNAAHPTRATRVSTLTVDLGGSHIRGLDATGTRLWALVDGAGTGGGPALPALVELDLE
ncbi:MAG: carboxypeptidase regulatory-like domain-containing protein [Myxococcales bacterium]|nr:carboxypeptidase regulatory-like domain-containing protein [Myxococcales bacterium]